VNNLINFEKNLAIIGGLLVLAGLGPAPYSLRLGPHEEINDRRARPAH
jgi:uncharacterized membrane protein YphA (DoxX/SURF4 family)